MPVYEYQCSQCGQIEEALQKISDSPLETCSHCKGHLKKIISQSTFHLKGSGWYVTDYGGAKTSTETKSDTETKTETKAETKSDTKKEIKPDTKKETKSKV
ncbi:MAG: zinc ribbon domain-containing protein [Desulfobacterales bacterium]|nr:zinc ribbon domain-containing protein [Desulfobacterales bacterium]